MNKITEKEAIVILKKYAPDAKIYKIILEHSKKVQKIALKIANEILNTGFFVDVEFIKAATLLHDIGRFKCPPGKDSIRHGVIGAEILLQEKLPAEALVCARHLGAGITKEEIIEKPDTYFVCDKQRHGNGWEGAIGLWFQESGQFTTQEGRRMDMEL